MEKSLKKGESLFKEGDSGTLWRVMQGAMKSLFPRIALGAFFIWLMCSAAYAHDFKVGDITIDHPYAIPTVTAQSTGAVYFVTCAIVAWSLTAWFLLRPQLLLVLVCTVCRWRGM